MPEHEFGGATSFKELERQGWGAKAGNYDALWSAPQAVDSFMRLF